MTRCTRLTAPIDEERDEMMRVMTAMTAEVEIIWARDTENVDEPPAEK